MNSELETLKTIWENNGKTNVRSIFNQTGLGIDYTRYICKCLFKKGQIQPIKGKRDWYRIISKGKKELKLRQLIKPKVSRRAKTLEKVTYYFPKKIKLSPSKINSQKVSIKKPKGSLIKPEEKKLNLGRRIEKAVSFLRKL